MRNLMLIVITFLVGCGTADHIIKYDSSNAPKRENCDLDVYSEGLTVSEKFKVIGEISVRDTGFSLNCSSEVVISKIKAQACQAGADAIQLFDVEHPHWAKSWCFQASARFLKYD